MMSTEERPLPDGLAAPARRALSAIGVEHLHHLPAFCELEIRMLHGMGPKALGRLRAAMDQSGLSFAQEVRPARSRR